MKKIFFSVLLFVGFSLSAQTTDDLIIELSDQFCDCISQVEGSKNFIWRKCSSKMLKENSRKIDKIANEFRKSGRNFENELWPIVNRRLSSSCDRYNSLIENSLTQPQ